MVEVLGLEPRPMSYLYLCIIFLLGKGFHAKYLCQQEGACVVKWIWH
jgi:hypothetical protein